jgi:hypothetical protein
MHTHSYEHMPTHSILMSNSKKTETKSVDLEIDKVGIGVSLSTNTSR